LKTEPKVVEGRGRVIINKKRGGRKWVYLFARGKALNRAERVKALGRESQRRQCGCRRCPKRR